VVLSSVTNPENGTVTYNYNSDNTLYYKTDAKGQVTYYQYDSKKRPTIVEVTPSGGMYGYEDACQRVTYSYDSNPYDSSFSSYTYGRLAAVQYGVSTTLYYNSRYIDCPVGDTYIEMYSYHPAGVMTAKDMQLPRGGTDPNGNPMLPGNLLVTYSYDNAGRTSSVAYPVAYPGYGGWDTFNYGYDSMGRPNTLTDNLTGYTVPWVQSVQYDYASRMTSFSYLTAYSGTGYPYWITQTMSYNVNSQLASLNWSSACMGLRPAVSSTRVRRRRTTGRSRR